MPARRGALESRPFLSSWRNRGPARPGNRRAAIPMAKRPNPTRIVTAAREKRPAADYVPWAVGAALVLAIGIIFGQTLDHGLLAFDDSGYVTDNPFVNRGISG